MEEFPQFFFLNLSPKACKSLGEEYWKRVEILLGSEIKNEDYAKAEQLRWIHSASEDLEDLSFSTHQKKETILTETDAKNQEDQAHFIMGVILAFAKQLFVWKEVAKFPNLHWDTKWKETVWKMKGKILLVIGAKSLGKELPRIAMQLGMRVFCVDRHKTFQPFCSKVFSMNELHSILPAASVVIANLPQTKENRALFGEKEIRSLKEDSIVVVNGCIKVVDEKALAFAAKKKLRGVLIEQNPKTPLALESPLWKLPNVLITPNISYSSDLLFERLFKDFRFNLRQYTHGNYSEMKNRLSPDGRGRIFG